MIFLSILIFFILKKHLYYDNIYVEVCNMFINSDFNITVTKVISTFRLINSIMGTSGVNNNRERWAIVLKTKGKTFYSINGKQVLSDKLHPVILPKGCSYSWKSVESGESITFEFDALEEFSDILSFEISDNSHITKTFTKIEKLLNSKDTSYQIECTYLLYSILNFLFKAVNKKYITKDKKELLRPATDYITLNYYDNTITNDSLALLCNISTVYFRKTFENVYGVSPIKFLNNFRIEKAKSMLLSDFSSIQQVAESVGYSSIYHFSKMFKLYTGISPGKYKTARLF